MGAERKLELSFSPPSPAEAEALDRAARYFTRAASEAGSRLLPGAALRDGQVELLAILRNNLVDSAAFCRCLLDVFDDWPEHSRQDAAQPPRA
jgi:hypothetical protein